MRNFYDFIKLIFLLLFITGLGSNLHAQNASQYTFTALSGTFVEITGTAFTPAQADDALSATTIPIGFTFNYCGANYTTIRAGSNGYMALLASSGQIAANTQANLNTIKPALMWLWDDLDGNTGTAVYTTTGTAPNRVFTFQYKNWEWNWSAVGPNITVQVKIFETTNIIEYHYRQESAAGNPSGSSGASIGICDNNATPTYLSLNNSGTNPTASSTVFTTNISAKPANGQIYRFSPPPNCSNVTGMPTSGTTSASPSTICLGGNVTLSFTPSSAMPAVLAITYNWQYGPSATGPWTNIPGGVTTAPTYNYTGATGSQYYRAQVLCNNNVIINGTASTIVNIPTFTTPTITNGTRCGPGTVNLSAVSSGNVIRWYQNATGGLPLFTGNNYTTPLINTTTTYYVTAGNSSVNDSVVCGAGSQVTGTTDYTTIFAGGWGGYKHQFLITQAELAAIGIVPGNLITNIGVTSTNGGTTYNGFTVSLLNTNVTALTTTFETGATAVYGPINYTTVNGYNNYTLTSPYSYTGGNLIIQTCWSNSTYSNPYTYLECDNTSFTSTHYYYQDNATPATVCALTSGGSTINKRPKFTFKISKYCETARLPVTATVTAPSIVTHNAASIICNNDITPINVSSPIANYNTYTWNALDGGSLYSDAAGLNNYVPNANATTIYFRSSNAGNHRIVLQAINNSNNCVFFDTVNIWVQPTNVQLTANIDTLCVPGGTSTMKLNPSSGYAPGSIVWETSTDGITYTVVPNGNNTSLTTPFIAVNTTRYYRVKINHSSGTCETLEKNFVVSDPTIIAVKDSFNCGPGQVQLEVVTGGFSDVSWYEQASGGVSVGSGNIFVTPFLTASKTYYAAAKGGGSLQGEGTVGNGTLTASGYQSPFYHLYGGHKNQFLVLASDIMAQGIPAGSMITSLAIDVVSGNTTYNDFTLQLATTNLNALPTNAFVGGLTQVTNTAAHTVTTGWNTFVFTTPFYWDGSNLVVQTCYNNNNYGGTSTAVRYSNTNYIATIYQRQDAVPTATICGNNTVYDDLNTLPNFKFGYDKSCESARVPVLADIREKPEVDLGPDYSKCVDTGHLEFLDAGNPGSNYLWDNQYNGQVRVVNGTGTYYVTVTNSSNCTDSDTINIEFKNNPKSALGDDTVVCNKQTVTLDAGNDGIQYYWNTGSTNSKITTSIPGVYSVQIIGSNGCIKTDTIEIIHNGEMPQLSGIQIQNQGPYTFKFNALNPANVIGYKWDFGDGSPYSYQNAPTHTYSATGNYLVTLWVSSSCGSVYDTMTAHIYSTGINNIIDDLNIDVYPNPTNNTITIAPKDDIKIEQITVFNVIGQVILNNSYKDNTKNKYIDLGKFADGMYQIQLITNKGTIIKKVEKISH